MTKRSRAASAGAWASRFQLFSLRMQLFRLLLPFIVVGVVFVVVLAWFL